MLEPQSDMGSSDLPPYPDQVLYAGEAMLGKYQRKTIAKEKQITQRDNISTAVCALLNSGGGIVLVSIADKDYNYIQHGLAHDIETILSKLVPFPSKDYCDLIQWKSFLLIFVKIWSTPNDFPKLRSLDTGLYVRSFTLKIESDGMQVLNRAIGNVKKARHSLDASRQPNEIKHWLDKPHLTVGENLGLIESEHVEFKDFSTGKLRERMKEIIKLYFSAFGNSGGGYLIIGVNDDGKITGCGKDLEKPELEKFINMAIDKVKIVHLHDCNTSDCKCKDSNGNSRDCDSHEQLYNLTIMDVKDMNQKDSGYVIFLEVKPVCCLAFADDPQCWILDPDPKGKKIKERLCACQWVKMMINKPSELLESQFERLCIGERRPLAGSTVCIKNGLENLQELQNNIFGSMKNGVTIKPDHLYSGLKEEYPGLEGLLQTMVANEEGVIILSRSWAVDLGEKSNPNIVCDALLLFSGKHPKLCSVVSGEVTETEFEYALGTARTFKKKLINLGGYTRKLCVIPAVLQLNSDNQEPPFPCPDITYPETYKLGGSEAVKELLQSLLIVMLSFRSYLSAKIGIEYFNLLTAEQYEMLSQKFVKGPFFVHGPPGTGKTVVALKIIKKIQNTFSCSPDNILFICENKPLRQYVSNQKICQAVTRSSFEIGEFPNVEHIVVDEAQNFQVENGNWFTKANQITERVEEKGIFYIFLDQFQSCHRRDTGLPPMQRNNVETLTKVIRSPEEIYNKMLETMKKIASRPGKTNLMQVIKKSKCCHGVSGHYAQYDDFNKAEIVKHVADTCKEYLSEGYTPGDIAILCSTDDAVNQYKPSLVDEMKEATEELRASVNSFVKAEDIMEDAIVLDSVRRFSGLERPIVFAINPVCKDSRVNVNLALCAASRATANFYLYYEPKYRYKRKSKETTGGSTSAKLAHSS